VAYLLFFSKLSLKTSPAAYGPKNMVLSFLSTFSVYFDIISIEEMAILRSGKNVHIKGL
jgi:hypothetical protein